MKKNCEAFLHKFIVFCCVSRPEVLKKTTVQRLGTNCFLLIEFKDLFETAKNEAIIHSQVFFDALK